jgi:hypothetical protein
MRGTSLTLARLPALIGAAVAIGTFLLAGAASARAETRTAVFKDGLGASAMVTWTRTDAGVKYRGTVWDKARDGMHARFYRVTRADADRIGTSLSGSTRGARHFRGTAPREVHFAVCTYDGDREVRCTTQYRYVK